MNEYHAWRAWVRKQTQRDDGIGDLARDMWDDAPDVRLGWVTGRPTAITTVFGFLRWLHGARQANRAVLQWVGIAYAEWQSTKHARFVVRTLEDLKTLPPQERFGDWAITDAGLENAKHGYLIAASRLWDEVGGYSWEHHLAAKEWCNFYDFWCAITEARRVHAERRPVRGVGPRFQVFKRDGYACRLCGRSARDGAVLEVDHITARARGGTNDMSNLWTLCWACNRGKRDDEL